MKFLHVPAIGFVMKNPPVVSFTKWISLPKNNNIIAKHIEVLAFDLICHILDIGMCCKRLQQIVPLALSKREKVLEQ